MLVASPKTSANHACQVNQSVIRGWHEVNKTLVNQSKIATKSRRVGVARSPDRNNTVLDRCGAKSGTGRDRGGWISGWGEV